MITLLASDPPIAHFLRSMVDLNLRFNQIMDQTLVGGMGG